MKTRKINKISLLVALLAVGAVAFAPVAAEAADDDTTVSVDVGGIISVVSSNAVNISLTPAVGGLYSSDSDTVTVTTNNSSGYDLTLADSDGTTSLTSGGNSFTAASGTYASPAALTAGRWGFAVAGGSFDVSYTAETNHAIDSTKWAGVPASGSAVNIKSTAVPAPSGDVTTVWYAAAADASQASGTYTDTVTYTATTK